MSDLHSIIEDSITDAEMPVEASTSDVVVSEGVESPESVEVAPEPSNEPTEAVPEGSEVPSPATKTEPESKDDLEKHLGPAQTVSGRENRIPYSRVKKITEKAVKEGVDAARKGWDSEYTPKYQELETKVKGYETKLQQVAHFEQLMDKEPVQFLERLATLPQYQAIFKQLFEQQQAQPTQPASGDPAIAPTDMPVPDEKMPDGSSVYSMQGLKSLLDWHAKQVEDRVTKQVTSRYAPLENDYQAHQRLQTVIPQVQAQITEARKWPMFNENEDKIVKALQDDVNISLEAAYQRVVYPQLLADRNKMRAELLKEIGSAPTSTSVPPRASKPNPVSTTTGPRSLEDVISESIKALK